MEPAGQRPKQSRGEAGDEGPMLVVRFTPTGPICDDRREGGHIEHEARCEFPITISAATKLVA